MRAARAQLTTERAAVAAELATIVQDERENDPARAASRNLR